MVGARFKGDVEVCAIGFLASLCECHYLCVGLARGLGVALADNVAILDDDGSDRWIGAGSACGVMCEGYSPRHGVVTEGLLRGRHAVDLNA